MKVRAALRRTSFLGLMVLACAMLAGCDAADPDAGKIVIRVANWSGAKEGNEYDKLVEQIYRDFEATHPGVVIREENVPGDYVAKMSLAFVAKAEPDVLMLDASSAALFINCGMVEDLAPFVARDRDFHLDDFFPNVVDIGRRGDKLFAIPNDFTPVVAYYNKRLFDRAGVPYPDSNWNFAKFRETAAKLTLKGDDPQYGFGFANWMPGWIVFLWGNGGEVLGPDGTASGAFDGPASIAAIQTLVDMVRIDGSAPSSSQTASMGIDPFLQGKAAISITGHWALTGFKAAPNGPDGKPTLTWDELGVVAPPHDTPEPRTVMYESGFALGVHGQHKDLAWEFVKHMTSYKAQKLYQSSGIAVCGRKDVAAERAKDSPLEAAFLPIIPFARGPYGASIEGYSYVEDQGKGAMDSALAGRPVAEAFGEAARKIDREFAKK